MDLREDFVELRVTAEAGRINRFCKSLLIRLPIFIEKSRQP